MATRLYDMATQNLSNTLQGKVSKEMLAWLRRCGVCSVATLAAIPRHAEAQKHIHPPLRNACNLATRNLAPEMVPLEAGDYSILCLDLKLSTNADLPEGTIVRICLDRKLGVVARPFLGEPLPDVITYGVVVVSASRQASVKDWLLYDPKHSAKVCVVSFSGVAKVRARRDLKKGEVHRVGPWQHPVGADLDERPQRKAAAVEHVAPDASSLPGVYD